MDSILFALSIVMSLTYAIFGLYVFRLGRKDKAILAFVEVCVSFFIWSFAYAFIFISDDIQSVWFWYTISAVGWLFAPFAVFRFFLFITRPATRRIGIVLRAVSIFIVAVMFYQVLQHRTLAIDFLRTSWGWAEVVDTGSIWFWVFNVYMGGSVLAGIVLLTRWGWKAGSIKTRNQAFVILLASSIFSAMVITVNIVLPACGMKVFPAIGHTLGVIWALGIFRAITKYRLMTLTPEYVVDQIVVNMLDLLVLTDLNRRITRINPMAKKLLEYSEDEMLKMRFEELIQETEYIIHEMDAYGDGNGSGYMLSELHLITKKKEIIPISYTMSLIRDKIGDPVGYFIIANDLREMKILEQEIRERKKIEVKLLSIHKELESKHSELISEQNKLKLQNEIVQEELNLARKMQMHFIPDKSPNPAIAFYYRPMYQVGGDYFEFVSFPDNRLGIFVSDASGHGVSAAFVTSMIKSISLQAASLIDSPAEFLFYLNELLLNLTGGNFVTAFYGIYDFTSRELLYSDAGHNAPLIIQSGTMQAVEKAPSLPLAVLSDADMRLFKRQYTDRRMTLQKGSKLFLYTDGLTETVNFERKQADPSKELPDFETVKMEGVFREFGYLSAKELVENMVVELIEFRGNDDFDDDVCMICMDVE